MSRQFRGACYEESDKIDMESLLGFDDYKQLPPEFDYKRIERC